MLFHILRNSRVTFCGRNAIGMRNVLRNDDTFGIANAIESGNLCPQCSLAAGI